MHRVHTLLVATIFFAAPSFSLAAGRADCAALLDEATKLDLSLPAHQFDQDDKRGWRALDAAGCTREAAVLIERYLIGYESNLRSLKWHQAQALAMVGQYPEAIRAARQALNPVEAQQHPNFRWNAYVLATIAFLEGKLPELKRQAQRIRAAVPKEPMNQVNLEVTEGLIKCFGRPYKDAYGCKSAP